MLEINNSNYQSKNKYFRIMSDGLFHRASTPEEEGSVWFERTNITTGEVKKYCEKTSQSLQGKITNMYFEENQFTGKTLQVWIDNEACISLPVRNGKGDNAFFQDFVKRLPNVDFSKEITLTPYKILDEAKSKEKEVFSKGIVIYQNGQKITSYYALDKDKKPLNKTDYPKYDETKRDTMGREDYHTLYFMEVKNFFVNEAQKIINKNQNSFTKKDNDFEVVDGEKVNLDDIDYSMPEGEIPW